MKVKKAFNSGSRAAKAFGLSSRSKSDLLIEKLNEGAEGIFEVR